MGKNVKDGIERKILLSQKQILSKIKKLGNEISEDYKGKDPILVGILKGSFLFMSDLAKEIDPEVCPEFDFMEISTYEGLKHKKAPTVEKDLSEDIKQRNVIIVEDIVDKGHSMLATLEIIKKRNPSSIKICSLLSKPDAREVQINIDYLGFEIPNKWVEGYGLDTNEKFRNLPDIWYRI